MNPVDRTWHVLGVRLKGTCWRHPTLTSAQRRHRGRCSRVARPDGPCAAARKTNPPIAATSSHSTTIALTSDERRLVVVNREANTLSIIRVKNAQGLDVSNKIAEIAVGIEPRCVAVSPDDKEAFVTNARSGTVAVVNLRRRRLAERHPRSRQRSGASYPETPLGATAKVKYGSSARLLGRVVGTVNVGCNPTAVAITNYSDEHSFGETVFVSANFC